MMAYRFEFFLKETALFLILTGLIFFSQPAAAQSNNLAAYTFITLAGSPGLGSSDGIGSGAQFNTPKGLAVDNGGNVYVADSYNYTIRKITAAGVVSTIAGFPARPGTNDGLGSGARFGIADAGPENVAVDRWTNVYVADFRTIRKLTPAGTNWMVTTIAGSAIDSGSANGTNGEARFNFPRGITVDTNGVLYVVDNGNNTIRKVTPIGTNWVVSTIAGLAGNRGSADGTNSAARFGAQGNGPRGITLDSAGNLYVADWVNATIRKITPIGTNWVVTTISGSVTNLGNVDGTNSVARFFYPTDVAADGAGNLFVPSSQYNVIKKITPVGTNWVTTTFAGFPSATTGNSDGTATNSHFYNPYGVAADSAGNVYVADTYNHQIRKITSAAVVNTIAGGTGSSTSTDGTLGQARFKSPGHVAVDSEGTVYVADTGNHTIRKITSAGAVNTIAGLAGNPGSVDGAGSDARFNFPGGVAVDSNGNVYVVGNQTLRRITPPGIVKTIAGQAGVPSFANGTNNGALFAYPTACAADNAGNIYVSDTQNFAIRRVRLVGTNWVVTTIAGQPGIQGTNDGLGNVAQFGGSGNGTSGIAVDTNGIIYVADYGNYTIRRLSPVGTNWLVTTIAGLARTSGNVDGTNSGARFNGPTGVAVNNSGDVFVTDATTKTIRKLTSVGTNWVVSTVGGRAFTSGSVDGAGSAALFSFPSSIVADSAGNIYIADSGNNDIRKGVFTANGAANAVAYNIPAMNAGLNITLLPPEANGQWRFPWEVAWHNSGQTVSNLVAGNYPVEFRNVPGWLAIPQGYDTVALTNGGTTRLSSRYYPTLTSGDTNAGTLMVNIVPIPPAGAGWRFLGDSTPFFPSGLSTNLAAGIYLIEFAPVSGFSKPLNQAVQVLAGMPMVLTKTYHLASAPPDEVLLPFTVPTNNINNPVTYPFAFNGQLQTDIGYGSGVAVEANVVLTAAHLVFNDQTKSYVNQVYWFFQRAVGTFEPEPLSVRSIYMLSGYASQRTNDVGGLGPDQSTPQSRNLDVAALYFPSPVAGGGYGGYLPSDTTPNQWLTGNSLKMLVGYPVDGSEFGDASIVPGKMYQTDPQPYALNLATDPVANQEVYTATWFLGYPGNSGGPVYAQFNGYYYPAGVYLGTLYNGVIPYASAVRAIDGDVVNLIVLAATQGATGTNHTGGGVITIIPNQAINAANPGYLQFQLNPPAAVRAGAGWKLSGDAAYSSATNYTRVVLSTNPFAVQFKPVGGWNVPSNQNVTVLPNQIATYMASYTVTNPLLVANNLGIGITGTTGTVYRIERRTSLTSGSWLPVKTNTIVTNGFNLLLPNPATNGSINFYRAVWLP